MTTEEYIQLIPKEPPEDIYEVAKANWSEFRTGVLSYKAISYAEAEALGWREDVVDLRTDAKQRPAEMWCSQCDRKMIGRYVPGEIGCHGYGSPSGVEIEDGYYQVSGAYQSGASLLCPVCGEQVSLKSASAMKCGVGAQGIITQCSVAGDKVVLTQWLTEKHIRLGKEWDMCSPMRAYILDEKKWVKLVKYRRNMGGRWYGLGHWEQLTKAHDEVGAAVMHPAEPCLDGTPLENAKLWEYKHQTYKSGYFLPIVYSKLYLRHRNVENLITAGFGKMLGQSMMGEANVQSAGYGAYKFGMAKLQWINWKECKPARMLGLTKEELRTARDQEWDAEKIKLYREHREHVTLPEMAEAFEKLGMYNTKRILEEPLNHGKLGRVMRYMEKQRENNLGIYVDYLRMANIARLDMTDDAVRWPGRLRDAHDRLAIANRYNTSDMVRARFEDMSKRCSGLNWAQGGICIRVAETPEELVQEGATLKHCVGGYAETHAKGKIILFIRHTRRPERSWFTLNLDISDKRIIQNHGYRNERLPNGKCLMIPKEVRQFVEDWKVNVLAGWSLPVKKGETA